MLFWLHPPFTSLRLFKKAHGGGLSTFPLTMLVNHPLTGTLCSWELQQTCTRGHRRPLRCAVLGVLPRPGSQGVSSGGEGTEPCRCSVLLCHRFPVSPPVSLSACLGFSVSILSFPENPRCLSVVHTRCGWASGACPELGNSMGQLMSSRTMQSPILQGTHLLRTSP